MTGGRSPEIEALRKRIAESTGGLLRYGDDEDLTLKHLPLGLYEVDEALTGGLAFNRFTLVIGEESAGKTLLCMLAMKRAQEEGRPAVFIDVERTWTPEWAEAVGIDAASVIVATPPTAEIAYDVVLALVKEEPHGVVVIDSIAAMIADDEAEAESAAQQFIGVNARLNNRMIKRIVGENTGWIVLGVNQIRHKVGVMYGSPETIPGGKGQRFFAHQIIRVRKGAKIEDGTGTAKTQIGYVLKVKVDKNKQGRPNLTAEVPFYFTGEFDEVTGLIDKALDFDLIVQGGGGYYTYGEERIRGRKGLRDWFAEDEDRITGLRAALDAVPRLGF